MMILVVRTEERGGVVPAPYEKNQLVAITITR